MAWTLPRLSQSGGTDIRYEQTALTLCLSRQPPPVTPLGHPFPPASSAAFRVTLDMDGGLEASHGEEEPLKAAFGTSVWIGTPHKSGKAAAFSFSVRRAYSSHKKINHSGRGRHKGIDH